MTQEPQERTREWCMKHNQEQRLENEKGPFKKLENTFLEDYLKLLDVAHELPDSPNKAQLIELMKNNIREFQEQHIVDVSGYIEYDPCYDPTISYSEKVASGLIIEKGSPGYY